MIAVAKGEEQASFGDRVLSPEFIHEYFHTWKMKDVVQTGLRGVLRTLPKKS